MIFKDVHTHLVIQCYKSQSINSLVFLESVYFLRNRFSYIDMHNHYTQSNNLPQLFHFWQVHYAKKGLMNTVIWINASSKRRFFLFRKPNTGVLSNKTTAEKTYQADVLNHTFCSNVDMSWVLVYHLTFLGNWNLSKLTKDHALVF